MPYLFIIGNGFDLFHKLPTTTSDFCKILSSKSVIGCADDALSEFNNYGIDWGEYENSLQYLDPQMIAENILQYPDYLSDYDSDREDTIFYTEEYLNSLVTAITDSLSDMVNIANDALYNVKIRLHNIFRENDAIISFNYTSTLEVLYDVKNNPLLHIHGYGSDGEHLIFGYKGDVLKNQNSKYRIDPDDDYYVMSQVDSIIMFCKRWQKKLKLKELKDYLNNLNGIDQVYVLGHSMSDVDSEYMECIEQIIRPNCWHISQFNNHPNINTLKSYSFKDKINYFSLSELS